MITRSRSFFYSVNLAVQKVKTRERTNTAINISQRWIIPVPQSTVLCRNTDLPSYYHSFVAVTGVNPLSQRREGFQTALKDIRAQRALPALPCIECSSTHEPATCRLFSFRGRSPRTAIFQHTNTHRHSFIVGRRRILHCKKPRVTNR